MTIVIAICSDHLIACSKNWNYKNKNENPIQDFYEKILCNTSPRIYHKRCSLSSTKALAGTR